MLIVFFLALPSEEPEKILGLITLANIDESSWPPPPEEVGTLELSFEDF